MLVKFMVGYDNEGQLNMVQKVFDTFEDAEHSANEHESRNPDFVFMVCKIVPAIRDTKEKELTKALEALLSFCSHNPDPVGWDRDYWTSLHRNAYEALGHVVPEYCK